MTRSKPPEMRQGHANPGPRTPAVRPATAPTAAPKAPRGLGRVGRKVWADVWEAAGSAYMPSTDRYVVERYCKFMDRRAALLAQLEAEGETTVGSQGQTVAHPAARSLADIESKMTSLEDRLGLNPESRLRLGLAQAQVRSALDAFEDGDPFGEAA